MARFGALLAILGITVLPLVSCGPLSFKGYQLLLDQPPSESEMSQSMGMDALAKGLSEGMNSARESGDPESGAEPEVKITPAPSDGEGLKSFYGGGHAWLQFLLLAIAGFAVLGLILGKPRQLMIALGVAGIIGLFVFVDRFNVAILDQAEKDGGEKPSTMGVTMFDHDTGSYIAMLGFGLMALGGFLAGQAQQHRDPPPPPPPFAE